MDEATWLACTDPGPMLKYLRWQGDSRKWRLFACACCRQVWDRLADDRLCRAVDLGEQYAEGLISVQEISGFRASGGGTSAWVAAKRRARSVAQVGDREVQCHLLRCLFRSPFRPVPVMDRAVLTWEADTVINLARLAHDDRTLPLGHLDPVRLAVLADALEEAGCTEAAILDHLRGPGPHWRGCHVLDLLTGRA